MIDTATGAIVGSFESGDQPHENNYSDDGKRIFHASIGTRLHARPTTRCSTPRRATAVFEIVDASTLQVLRRLNMGEKLAEAGYPNMSAAVRPMALAPDERFVYFQVSFFHGFVEYDLVADRVTRLATLPQADDRDGASEYVLDSAHHGLTMNPRGDEAVRRGDDGRLRRDRRPRDRSSYQLVDVGSKPYWSTNSGDGKLLLRVGLRRRRGLGDLLPTSKEVARVPVGDHPQRMRMGKIRRSYLR